jgi:catechol 2,3-dioxygenase-like lactoylglutathione lyase family enzyme
MRRAAADLLSLMEKGPACVPELLVTALPESLRFWVGICGFSVLYERPEEGFAMVTRDGAWIMLDQLSHTRDWVAAPLERPFGRGLNLEFSVPDAGAIHAAVQAAGTPIFLPMEEKRYRIGAGHVRVRQFIAQDPDGYLLRFSQLLEATRGG